MEAVGDPPSNPYIGPVSKDMSNSNGIIFEFGV